MVISNVFTNVRVHAGAAAEVTVTIEQHDRRHVLEVADTGPGVPADALAHLFDRFYRAAPGTQRGHGALGEQRHRTMASCRRAARSCGARHGRVAELVQP
jgi:signal transduction histidine kinase